MCKKTLLINLTFIKASCKFWSKKFSKSIPTFDFSADLCSQADCLGLAVEPKIWEKIEFENKRG